MALTVYITHDLDCEKETILYRLQTLAVSADIDVLLPPLGDRDVAKQRIDQADYVIALVTYGVTDRIRDELDYALAQGKPRIPILVEGVSLQSEDMVWRWISFSPMYDTPASVEDKVFDALHTGGEVDRRIVVLVGLVLGLLWLQTYSSASR